MGDSKTECVRCNVNRTDFDAQLAFRRLAHQQQHVAAALTALMADAVVPAMRQSTASKATPSRNNVERFTELMERIVGGHPTQAYPECCLIGHRGSNGGIGWFCTGVLVHRSIVLTAGHCFVPARRANVVALNTSDQNELQSSEIIGVKRLAVHPRYQQTGQLSDVTVLVLRTPATTPPVRIASTSELNAATRVTLVGFGNDDVNSTRGFGRKRQVSVELVSLRRDREDNLNGDEQLYGYESDFEFVAGGQGFDSCNGDSGGPAYIAIGGVRMLAGLTSRATDNATHGCGDGGIYTRIDVHLDFVRQVAHDAQIDFAS